MISNLRLNNNDELNEIRLETDMKLQCIDITDFDKFIGIRLSYYAVVLAIFAIILSSQELIKELPFDVKSLVGVIITL